MLGNVVDFARDPLGFLTRCGEHGDIVRLKLEHSRDTFLITDPDDIETVLMNREGKFSKGYQGDPILHLVLGNGLVTSEGEFWRKQRRLAQPFSSQGTSPGMRTR